jgi:hypothetical protein
MIGWKDIIKSHLFSIASSTTFSKVSIVIPGSKLILLYRNNIFNENNLSGISYYSSTKELFQKPIDHQVSIRINYFLDYNLIKRKKKRI